MKQWATGGNIGRSQDVIQPGRAAGMPGVRPVDDLLFMRIVVDATAGASRAVGIPARIYRFVTIFNNSRFDFSLSRGIVFNPLDIIGNCPAYTLLTFPFDQETSDLFIRWDGTTGANERALIFLTDDNLGLVGQFRPPSIAPAHTIQMVRENFGTTFFRGVIAVGTLFTATTICDVKSFYVTNTLDTAATVTLVHRRPGVADVSIVHRLSIAGNFTYAIGYIALEAGDSIVATAVTGTVHVLMYGVR